MDKKTCFDLLCFFTEERGNRQRRVQRHHHDDVLVDVLWHRGLVHVQNISRVWVDRKSPVEGQSTVNLLAWNSSQLLGGGDLGHEVRLLLGRLRWNWLVGKRLHQLLLNNLDLRSLHLVRSGLLGLCVLLVVLLDSLSELWIVAASIVKIDSVAECKRTKGSNSSSELGHLRLGVLSGFLASFVGASCRLWLRAK
ncbi:unnamed protein product [Cyberlindnera jadinii]|uniref:Uncharacterized protein n=1 Tax=Cyberlindnera jadinii (strain ATCC 18201 / CBS 1600 / BCRC 20928 / JCM 3617 / NBRC 0987 / NRRL Y-1542) TaxID=983966 RepID=A0A0H5BXZ5_CYBJN|nr:unnamed protein product [Cyberlindnera jadinii]